MKAGVEDVRLHDLRHEGISRMFEAGYQIQEVALVSGHRDWSALRRYTNLRPALLHAREAAMKEKGATTLAVTPDPVPHQLHQGEPQASCDPEPV